MKGMDPSEEEERYRFGPGGIAIAFKRPGLSVWSRQNSTKISYNPGHFQISIPFSGE